MVCQVLSLWLLIAVTTAPSTQAADMVNDTEQLGTVFAPLQVEGDEKWPKETKVELFIEAKKEPSKVYQLIILTPRGSSVHRIQLELSQGDKIIRRYAPAVSRYNAVPRGALLVTLRLDQEAVSAPEAILDAEKITVPPRIRVTKIDYMVK